ncbi:MAG: hypothetical protein ABJB09_04335 [Verrucomicrobiota bacterium]
MGTSLPSLGQFNLTRALLVFAILNAFDPVNSCVMRNDSSMKGPISWPLLVGMAGAIVTGVLLDRWLLSATSRHEVASSVALTQERAPLSMAAAPNASDASPAEETRPSTESAGQTPKSLEAILAVRDPRQRTRDLLAFVTALEPREFADALKRIRQMTSSNERELASRLLVTQWVQTDPDGAMQFAAANRNFAYLAEDVFQQRAMTDFQSALSSAREIAGVDLRYRALRGVLSFKAESDPVGAIQLAQTLGEFRGNEPLTNALYRQWAATDPKAAAAYASQQGVSGEEWRSPVFQVVNAWANQDPAAAAGWSLSLPDPEARARSLTQVMRDWGRQDPTASASWLNSMPPGATRDAAVAGLAQSIVSADPQTALRWIATISDETTRQRALRTAGRVVMMRDPQNGAALLQGAGMPAAQVEQLQHPRRP